MIRAPQLDAGLGWLNTDRPLRFDSELKGQVVVLDFWTYCCINCIHILPDLAFLENKYENDPVTFIGVHSSKFSNEASRETIRAAILRYEIAHPVVIDDQMKLWRAYAVRSWPTVVVVSPAGRIVAVAAGEGNRETIDHAIAETLAQGRAEGTLAAGPLALRRQASVRAASGLAFPGKVLADADARRLYVADSNHNRIVIAEWPDAASRARVIQVVGTGRAGSVDGPPEVATFNHPQGLVAGHGNLYVADTENHLIRSVDLATFHTTTIVGTGEMCNDRAGGAMGTQQGLNSPWDLCLEGSTLYVAMAGAHQVWRIDLPVGFARAFAGSGRENLVDGPTETAALAQTSGICAMGGNLYVADSEVSAVRGIDMTTEQVFTIVGQGLFSFGDVDGTQPSARLQHPLGVAAWRNTLLVADTYNHKIKAVDPRARSVRTLYGTGRPGTDAGAAPERRGEGPREQASDEATKRRSDEGKEEGNRETEGASTLVDASDLHQALPAFFEPGGLSVAGDVLFVADTNNHRIITIELKTHAWQELSFDGLTQPAEQPAGSGSVVTVDPVAIVSGRDIAVELNVQLPPGAHVSPEVPWSIRIEAGGATLATRTGRGSASPVRSGESDKAIAEPGQAPPGPTARLSVRIPADAVVTGERWRVSAALAYCTEQDGGLCVPLEFLAEVPIKGNGDAKVVTLNLSADAGSGGGERGIASSE